MTAKLEQEFFKVFGVEPKYQDACTVEDKYWQNEELANKYGTFDMYMNAKCGNQENCTTRCSCAYTKEIYPEITDRKLLEMICINSYFCGVNFHHLWVKNPDEIKAIILDEIIRWYKEQKYGYEKCKHQIQQLFKEEE